MTPKLSTFEDNRRTRRTLFIVAGVYVGIGFFIAAPAALAGDPVTAFLGCLVICGALAGAVGLNAVLKLSAQMSEVGNALDELRRGLRKIESSLPTLDTVRTNASSAESAANIDMAALGGANLAALTAATFDREAYPRLAITKEDQPQKQASEIEADEEPSRSEPTTSPPDHPEADDHSDSEASTDVAENRLIDEWEVAMRDGDLSAAREVFPLLADTVAPDFAATLQEQLDRLTAKTAALLREQFVTRLDQQDYTAALAIGQRMCALLPDHRITADFCRIRPHLQRRAEKPTPREATLAVVH